MESKVCTNWQPQNLTFFNEALSVLHINWLKKIIFINVSDLVFCPREITFKRLNKLSESQNQDIENRILRGRLLTIQLQQLLLTRYPGQFEIEKQVQYDCSNYYGRLSQDCIVHIVGRIDAFNKDIGPFEFKATNSLEKIREPKSYDVQQVKYYMTMTNSPSGLLLYYHLDPKFADHPPVKFCIAMTDDELYSEHRKLVESALSFSEAISVGKPELASHVAFDRELSWKCKFCQYSGECKSMRIAANGFKSSALES